MSTPLPSAVELLARMQRGELTAEQLVTDVLARIAAVNPRLNAVADMDAEAAMQAARAADARRAAGDQAPLLGLPVTLKDSIDASGLRCTGGSFARAAFRPTRDATVTARLRAAGAIIIAKTNLPEYSSSYETDSALLGRCNHPLDPERTPGGSSGGEGALLGAGASVAGIGIDGGGSIRVPSHYCGTVGLRPTPGRVPDTGTWPVTRETGYRDLMCVGPMARHVSDLHLLLQIIAGPDDIDPYTAPVPLGEPGAVALAGLRVGWFDNDGITPVSAATSAAVNAAATVLAAAGAEVRAADMPDLAAATPLFFALAGADGGTRTRADLQGADGRHHAQFAHLLAGFGAALQLADFFALQRRVFDFRARLRGYMQAHYDVLLAPVTTGPAPRHGEASRGVPQAEYFTYRGFNYSHAFSLAGLPVAVVPAGVEDSLPLGVQVIARPWREDVALAAAACIERSLSTAAMQASTGD